MRDDRAKDPARLSGPSVREPRRSYVEDQYPTLVRNNRLGAGDLTRLRHEASGFGYRPQVSVVMPVLDGGAELLERALDSVLGQVYANWELCICDDASAGGLTRALVSRYERLDDRVKVAYPESTGDAAGLVGAALPLVSGEFVCVLGGADELAPDALIEVVRVLQEHPETDVVYTDEDDINENGSRSRPRFKPGWSPDLLLSDNYVSRLSVYRKSVVIEAGGFGEGLDGHEGYDLILRVTERTREIRHVPRVLYHRRRVASGLEDPADGDGGLAGARCALIEALRRRGIEGSVEDGLVPGHLRAKAKVEGRPKVSLIVPTRDNVSLLKNCIESVERETTYDNYEILIVDNDSADPETLKYLASTPHRVVPFREPFNYSRINNFAVARSEGDYVVLLNDDTEVISDGWLEAMLEHAQRPEVGAVGAKLVYPDGRIQHAGVLIGVGGVWSPGVATHAHQFYPSTSPGYLGLIGRVTNYSAVTAACMMLRRSAFDEVEGFDEENLKVSFNDVDLCLRLRERGYSVVYTPYAELYHHESVSRGYKGNPSEVLYMRRHWGATLDGEPFYNPHFSRGSGDFNLRADMLGPRVLRSEKGRSRGTAGSFEDALASSAEEVRGYVEAQQDVARSSHRASLVPARADKRIRIETPPREEPEQDGASVERGDVRGGDAPRGSAGRLPAEASGGLRAEQLIWMFGSPRTGSTWLSRMMAELEGQERWHEPYVGLLFGSFLYERLGNNTKLLNSPAFIMGEPHRRVWLDSIRSFVMKGAEVRYPNLESGDHLVIKEPNGSVGAPLLLEATPESRLIFLIRDPRDVVASRLDAFKKDSWSAQNRDLTSDKRLNAFTKELADDYSNVVSQVHRAYEAHPGEKTLVRYEELREDTVGTLKGMYEGLKITVDANALEAAAAKHAWEQVPEGNKGPGKFYRKAKPGGWEEDLTAEQVRIIEDATGEILAEFYGADRPV